MKTNQLFYLTGFQRSGTTLLCQLLDKHPDILCAEEPEFAKRIFYNQHDKLKDPKNDSIKRNLDFYDVKFEDYLKIINNFSSDKLSIHDLLVSCYKCLNRKNASIIGAKEVIDIVSDKFNFIESLITIHPKDTKYIFIERNVEGVVASFIKMGFFPPSKRKLNNFNLARFAKKYKKIQTHAKSIMPKEHTLFITYKELLDEPQITLKSIYNFLDVNADIQLISQILNTPRNGVRNNYTEIDPTIKDNWKNILTERHLKILKKTNG